MHWVNAHVNDKKSATVLLQYTMAIAELPSHSCGLLSAAVDWHLLVQKMAINVQKMAINGHKCSKMAFRK
jgi:hypothetical protein